MPARKRPATKKLSPADQYHAVAQLAVSRGEVVDLIKAIHAVIAIHEAVLARCKTALKEAKHP